MIFIQENNLSQPKSYIYVGRKGEFSVYGVDNKNEIVYIDDVSISSENSFWEITKLCLFDNDKKLIFIDSNNKNSLLCYDLEKLLVNKIWENNNPINDFSTSDEKNKESKLNFVLFN